MPPRKRNEVSQIDEPEVLKPEPMDTLPAVPNGGVSLSKRQDMVADVTNVAALRSLLGTKELSWDEIEPSFEVIKDKSVFEGKPFLVAGFRFNQSKQYSQRNAEGELIPADFVSMLIAPLDEQLDEFIGPWVVINDGSTGIMQQLVRYVKRITGDPYGEPSLCPPFTAKRGLRKSEYMTEVPDKNGELNPIEATTWYIA